MWHTEDDIINDLAFLNDFGVPGDKEPYKILYSSGRGSRVQEKPTPSASFLDPRTGETVIDDDSFELKGDIRGKGRGSTLGSLAKANLQLLKQLRLARPLGSSDQIIESYCQRHKPTGESSSSSDTMVPSCSEQKFPKSIPEDSTACDSYRPNKNIQRVKGVRNSNLQNNALIAGLLSKTKEKSGSTAAEEEKNGDGKLETSKINEQKYNSERYVPPHRRKELQDDEKLEDTFGDVPQNSAPNPLSNPIISNLNWSSIYDKDISLKKNGEEKVQKTLGKVVNNHDSCSNTNESSDCSKSTSDQSSVDSLEENVDEQAKCNELYRKLGERLNKKNKVVKRICRGGIYDFDHDQYDSSISNECNEQFEVMVFPQSEKNFALDQKDFPPLCIN